MTERRSLPRRHVLKAAQIEIDRSSAFPCKVRNVTHAGALLRVPSVIGVPDHFELTIDPSDDRQACRVVWRSLDELGVRFERVATALC